MALQDNGLRQRIKNDLRASRHTREHKLDFGTYLRGKGGILLGRLAKSSGHTRTEALALLQALPPLEFYMPVAAHRAAWTGGGNLIVASQLVEGEAPVGFRTGGSPVTLTEAAPPVAAVLVLVPLETDFTAAVSSTWENQDDQAGQAVGTLAPMGHSISASLAKQTLAVRSVTAGGSPGLVTTFDLPPGGCDSDVTLIEGCGDSLGAGPPTPMFRDLPGYTGIYMQHARIWDKAEPWPRGDPEIEVHVRGTEQGEYIQTPPGLPGTAPGLGFISGPIRVGFSCAGANAYNTPVGLRRFDFNDEDGRAYTQNVLLAEPQSFVRKEEVMGGFGVLLHRRLAAMGPPFEVRVLERDDGGECPEPTQTTAVFRASVSVNFYPEFSYNGWSAQGSLDGFLNFIGIHNGNDVMGAWTIGSWDELEGLEQREFQSSYLDVWLANNGMSRTQVPPGQDPYNGP